MSDERLDWFLAGKTLMPNRWHHVVLDGFGQLRLLDTTPSAREEPRRMRSFKTDEAGNRRP